MTNRVEKVRHFANVCVQNHLVWAGLVLAVLACSSPKVDSHKREQKAVAVTAIRVSPTNLSLAIGQTQHLSVALGDAAGNRLPVRMVAQSLVEGSAKKSVAVIGDSMGRTGRIVTWSSSQPSRVSVDAGGLVTARAVGEATITAQSGGQDGTMKVTVLDALTAPVTVIPAEASLPAGEKLQLHLMLQDDKKGGTTGLIRWSSDQPSCATVNQAGLVKAIAPGTTTITVSREGQTGTAVIKIAPTTTIYGLDFPGNAGVNTTMRFEFTSPLEAYPATYIWRAYPRQQQSYYTAFFWGNNGAFYPSNIYYGFHPYPDWNTAYQHFWEIAAAPGGDFISSTHVVYDRWYLQVAVCRKSGDTTVNEFYWDWPDDTKVVRHSGKPFNAPPNPGLVVGDAPWNQGNEVWDGILRGFQFYDAAMKRDEIEQEIASPGAVRKPWYINLNPTPTDISDKSGNEHHPSWVGAERPFQWTGTMNAGSIVSTTVPPR